MFNGLPILVRRAAAPLAALLASAGCAGTPQVGRPAAGSAQVSVANLTDYTWRVEIVSDAGQHFTAQLDPRRSAELEVPGGLYQIDQSILTQTERPNPPRHLTATLVAGKKYRWPLATLQSDPPAASPEPGGAD